MGCSPGYRGFDPLPGRFVLRLCETFGDSPPTKVYITLEPSVVIEGVWTPHLR